MMKKYRDDGSYLIQKVQKIIRQNHLQLFACYDVDIYQM